MACIATATVTQGMNMETWIENLGPVGWPLIICSVLAFAVFLDRMIFFIGSHRSRNNEQHLIEHAYKTLEHLDSKALENNKHPWAEGFRLILRSDLSSMKLREETVNLWLAEQRSSYLAHTRWLTIVAVISPLLGLLGTVLGMVVSFEALVAHNGPIQPAVLADGLRQAMLTTVVGLAIAIPSLTAVHVFRLWGEARLDRLQQLLGKMHLAIEGVFDQQWSSRTGDLPQDVLLAGKTA